ncbi:DUF6165 family protein [Paracoccus marinus]|uniref:DUF6165 family protein n=1 Tax=Paracoccus marinus TaxID=288426 RepID=UPI00103B919D|nr:DUF6165 family protein [Paracoccus marinus]GLS80838.1 hypothetical protein GCM10007893_16300 [Paracoccus marinus]
MITRAPIPPTPLVPVSWGELLDKITILELKARLIPEGPARANVTRELDALREVAAPALGADENHAAHDDLGPLLDALRATNAALWQIEDDIRVKEAQGRFDDRFVALARSVYVTNDERARIKRRINDLLGSALVEEKHHPHAGRAPQAADAGPAAGLIDLANPA